MKQAVKVSTSVAVKRGWSEALLDVSDLGLMDGRQYLHVLEEAESWF